MGGSTALPEQGDGGLVRGRHGGESNNDDDDDDDKIVAARASKLSRLRECPGDARGGGRGAWSAWSARCAGCTRPGGAGIWSARGAVPRLRFFSLDLPAARLETEIHEKQQWNRPGVPRRQRRPAARRHAGSEPPRRSRPQRPRRRKSQANTLFFSAPRRLLIPCFPGSPTAFFKRKAAAAAAAGALDGWTQCRGLLVGCCARCPQWQPVGWRCANKTWHRVADCATVDFFVFRTDDDDRQNEITRKRRNKRATKKEKELARRRW